MTKGYGPVRIWQVEPSSGRSVFQVGVWLDWLGARVGPETLIVQNQCGWKGHDTNLWRKIDTQVFGRYGFAKTDAQTTLPSDKVPANINNIQLLREASHSL